MLALKKRLPLAAALLTLLMPLPAAAEGNFEQPVWQVIADDLQVARIPLWQHSLLTPELLLIRTKLLRYRVGVVQAVEFGSRKAHVLTLCHASQAIAGINANFFDERGSPLGLVLSRGFMYRSIHDQGHALTGILQVTRGGIEIVHRRDFAPHNVIEGIQAGPRLIVDRTRVTISQDSSYSRRAGICLDGHDRLIIYITAGVVGATTRQVQDALLAPEIDCVNALNLDGGGSAQLFVSHRLPNASPDLRDIVVHGADDVPVMLGLFVRN
jgi:hypothetical protein